MRPPLPISRYTLLRKKQEQSGENEIKLKAQARAYRYALYAAKILFEGKHEIVHLHAIGAATPKVIQAVEFLRKRIKGLHTAYEISSTEFHDEYHPLEKGLDVVIVKRLIPTLKAQLTVKNPDAISKNVGYMSAVDEKEVVNEEFFRKKVEEHFSRERIPREEGGEHHERQRSDSRGGRGGRGRGRGFPNRGRGTDLRGGRLPEDNVRQPVQVPTSRYPQNQEERPQQNRRGQNPRPDDHRPQHNQPAYYDQVNQKGRNQNLNYTNNRDYDNFEPRRDRNDSFRGRGGRGADHRDDYYQGPSRNQQPDNYNRGRDQYNDTNGKNQYNDRSDNRPQRTNLPYREPQQHSRVDNYRSSSKGRDYREYTYSEFGKEEGRYPNYEQERNYRGANQASFRGQNRPQRGGNSFRGNYRGPNEQGNRGRYEGNN